MTGFYTLEPVSSVRVKVRALLITSIEENNIMDTIITAHHVEAGAQGALLSEGVAFSAEHRDELMRVLVTPNRVDQRNAGLMPRNVLDVTGARLVWWIKGKARPMYFAQGRKQIRVLVPWPSLILEATERGLRVCAVYGTRRPAASTPVYRAPLMNIGADGSMCAGTAKLPTGRTFAEMAAYEAALFDSNFSHVNNPLTLQLGSTTVENSAHLKFWKRLQRTRADVFPVENLVPLARSLEQWVSR